LKKCGYNLNCQADSFEAFVSKNDRFWCMEDDELVAMVAVYEVYVTCDKTIGMNDVLIMDLLA
jgi:hypothetical protein